MIPKVRLLGIRKESLPGRFQVEGSIVTNNALFAEVKLDPERILGNPEVAQFPISAVKPHYRRLTHLV